MSLTSITPKEKAEFLESLVVTDEERREIMYAPQRTDEWKGHREKRLTASNFGAAAGHNKHCPIAKLLKQMLWPEPFTNEAIERGIKMEPHIFQQAEIYFSDYYRRNGYESIWLEEVGLYISKTHAWLAASSDGLLHLDDKTLTIEIKAPKKLPKNIHPYYFDQIQGTMACLGIKEAWFIVYGVDKTEYRRFPFNEQYWKEQLFPALQYYYMNLFLPRYLLKKKGLLPYGEINPITSVPKQLALENEVDDTDKDFNIDKKEENIHSSKKRKRSSSEQTIHVDDTDEETTDTDTDTNTNTKLKKIKLSPTSEPNKHENKN